jgi:hypothetical protein
MKSALMILVIAFASTVFANPAPIKNRTCRLYLPVNAQITSWSTSQEAFINKGYTPIQVAQDFNDLKTRELAASISIHANGPEHFIGRNHCAVSLTINELLDDGTAATRFVTKQNQSNGGDSFHCEKAVAKALKEVPYCQRTR